MEILQNIAVLGAWMVAVAMFITGWMALITIHSHLKEIHEIVTQQEK